MFLYHEHRTPEAMSQTASWNLNRIRPERLGLAVFSLIRSVPRLVKIPHCKNLRPDCRGC